MNQRVAIALVGLFVVIVLGVVAVVLISSDSDDTASEPTVEECVEPEAVVTAAQENVSQLTNATEIRRDAEFYALLVSEQRTITYVMDAEPACFTLAERARANGLLDAFSGLLAVADPAPETVDLPAPAPTEDPGE
ncbi:MAG: hypothetical protein ACR2O6_06910 [Ilumatobacteraceae bacterium]